MNQPLVKIENGKPMTTSVAVATFFGKQHKNVLEVIRTAIRVVPDEWAGLNFQPGTYIDRNGQNRPAYFLTKSGFAMTALGFTGEKALHFRYEYVKRFDEMEAALHEKEIKKLEQEFVEKRYLPFDEQIIRDSVSLGDACKHLRILGVHVTLTPGQLKGKVKRGEYEGHQDERGHWRIYVDEVTRLATGH